MKKKTILFSAVILLGLSSCTTETSSNIESNETIGSHEESPREENLVESSSEITDTKGVEKAQFWKAKCYTENRELGSWSNQEIVAQNSADNHKRNNSTHSVGVISK